MADPRPRDGIAKRSNKRGITTHEADVIKRLHRFTENARHKKDKPLPERKKKAG